MGKYFGTDGARGVANKQITGTLAYRIGRYIGQCQNGHKNKILIASDTRISGKLFKDLGDFCLELDSDTLVAHL